MDDFMKLILSFSYGGVRIPIIITDEQLQQVIEDCGRVFKAQEEKEIADISPFSFSWETVYSLAMEVLSSRNEKLSGDV